MTDTRHADIEKPRIQSVRPLVLGGRRESFTAAAMQNVPALWQRFIPEALKLGAVSETYGVVFGRDGGVDYMAAVEVPKTAGLPTGWTSIGLPAQTYAVFAHRGHVSTIGATVMDACRWLDGSEHERLRSSAEEPSFLEHYSKAFDPKTGMGGMEAWVPVKA